MLHIGKYAARAWVITLKIILHSGKGHRIILILDFESSKYKVDQNYYHLENILTSLNLMRVSLLCSNTNINRSSKNPNT